MRMLHQPGFNLDRTVLTPGPTVISEVKLKLINPLLQYVRYLVSKIFVSRTLDII